MSAEGKSKIFGFICPASVGWPEMVVVLPGGGGADLFVSPAW